MEECLCVWRERAARLSAIRVCAFQGAAPLSADATLRQHRNAPRHPASFPFKQVDAGMNVEQFEEKPRESLLHTMSTSCMTAYGAWGRGGEARV